FNPANVGSRISRPMRPPKGSASLVQPLTADQRNLRMIHHLENSESASHRVERHSSMRDLHSSRGVPHQKSRGAGNEQKTCKKQKRRSSTPDHDATPTHGE